MQAIAPENPSSPRAEDSHEAELRASIEDWLDAVRAKDTPRVIAHYAEDVVTFDIAPPFETRGRDAIKKRWEVWPASFDGPIGYRMDRLSLRVAGDTAFVHSINHITGRRRNGEDTNMYLRATVGLRREQGRWVVVHEHISVPIDMDTLRPLFGVRP